MVSNFSNQNEQLEVSAFQDNNKLPKRSKTPEILRSKRGEISGRLKQYYNRQHSRRSSTVSEDDHTILTDDNFKVTEKSSDLA